MSSKNLDNLINEKAAAKILDKGVQSLRNDRHLCKGIPYIKIGRSVRYSLEDINRYIDDNRITPEFI